MTPNTEGPIVRCPTPIDREVLADYWLALLPPSEEEGVETHLMTCDACGERLQEVILFSEALHELAQSGAFSVIVPEEYVTHAIEGGRRVRQYSLGPGETVHCTISADDDFLISRYSADLGGAERVDLSFSDRRGVERHRMHDIPVRTEAGCVVVQESTPFAKSGPSGTMIARLFAVSEDGQERLLGEYTMQHTRTIPGPPAFEW